MRPAPDRPSPCGSPRRTRRGSMLNSSRNNRPSLGRNSFIWVVTAATRVPPASLTQREQVHIVGDAIGRQLRFDGLSRESARERMLAMTFPPPVAEMLLDAYAAAVGQPALVTSTGLDVTGAPARSFRDWPWTTPGIRDTIESVARDDAVPWAVMVGTHRGTKG